MYLVSHWHVLISSYYLTVSKFALIDCIEKWRVHSELWQFQMGGYMIRCTWCHTDISLYLPIRWGVTLTFPYIFLLLDCFEFALIDCIEKWRVHSELWQFQIGGYIVRCTWCHTDMSLYLPIIWLFRICSHWLHWKVKSSLWALAVSNGGVYDKMHLVSHWHFLISSYYLTALKSEEFTLSSGSFKWGGYCQMYLVSHWHFLISSYYLTVLNGLSLTALKSEEFTLSSGSFKWGG